MPITNAKINKISIDELKNYKKIKTQITYNKEIKKILC